MFGRTEHIHPDSALFVQQVRSHARMAVRWARMASGRDFWAGLRRTGHRDGWPEPCMHHEKHPFFLRAVGARLGQLMARGDTNTLLQALPTLALLAYEGDKGRGVNLSTWAEVMSWGVEHAQKQNNPALKAVFTAGLIACGPTLPRGCAVHRLAVVAGMAAERGDRPLWDALWHAADCVSKPSLRLRHQMIVHAVMMGCDQAEEWVLEAMGLDWAQQPRPPMAPRPQSVSCNGKPDWAHEVSVSAWPRTVEALVDTSRTRSLFLLLHTAPHHHSEQADIVMRCLPGVVAHSADADRFLAAAGPALAWAVPQFVRRLADDPSGRDLDMARIWQDAPEHVVARIVDRTQARVDWGLSFLQALKHGAFLWADLLMPHMDERVRALGQITLDIHRGSLDTQPTAERGRVQAVFDRAELGGHVGAASDAPAARRRM